MTLVYTEEGEQLRETVRAFLGNRSPEPEVRRLMLSDHGYDPGVWREMGEQLGLQGLAVPEEHGGAGSGFVAQCIVMEEMGARLFGGPYLSSAVTAVHTLLSMADDDVNAELFPGIASGRTVATLAVQESPGGWNEGGVQLRAQQRDDGWVLDGMKTHVLDGTTADLILVAGRSPAGISLFAVNGDAPGLQRTSLPTMDLTRKQALLTFQNVQGRLIGSAGGAWAHIRHGHALTCIALSSESVGGSQAALDMAVGYANDRIQFGRAIGSFQAIKHLCADMLLAVESARSLTYEAAGAVDSAADTVELLASIAKSYVGDAYWQVAADNIQVHGGIGFTWEHPAHLYLKRALSSRLLFGDADVHRDRAATLLGYDN